MGMAQVSPSMPLMLHFLWIRQGCNIAQAEEGHGEQISSEILTLSGGNCVCPHWGNLVINSCFPRKPEFLGAGAMSSLGLCGHRPAPQPLILLGSCPQALAQEGGNVTICSQMTPCCPQCLLLTHLP